MLVILFTSILYRQCYHTGVNGIEKVGALLGFLDVGVDEQRVCFGMDILHHDLKAVEATGLRNLNLRTEALNKVLVHDTIRSGEEGQDMGNEVPLVIVHSVPVVEIFGQVDFLCSPEGSFCLFVHLPNLYQTQRVSV